MCKNNSWKIRTSGEGVVLEIQTHPDRGREGGLKIRDFRDFTVGISFFKNIIKSLLLNRQKFGS